MTSVVQTYVFVGGPADGQQIEFDNEARELIDMTVAHGTATYERALLHTPTNDYVYWRVQGMDQSEAVWRLLTRYHGGA